MPRRQNIAACQNSYQNACVVDNRITLVSVFGGLCCKPVLDLSDRLARIERYDVLCSDVFHKYLIERISQIFVRNFHAAA